MERWGRLWMARGELEQPEKYYIDGPDGQDNN
jgi:hypothetical protein